MLEGFLVLVFIGCMLFLVVHEGWLQLGNPRFVLGVTIAAVGILAALGLMVLL